MRSRVESELPVEATTCEGPPALRVHAPGEIRQRLAAGTYRAQGQFGVCGGAYRDGARTDGVVFGIRKEEGDRVQLLFSRLLDPLSVPEDRGLQRFDVLVTVDASADLVLSTDPGAVGDSRWDWSFWADLRVEPISP